MRLVTFVRQGADDHGGTPCIGALIENDNTVVDIQAAHMSLVGDIAPNFTSMLALIDGGAATLESAHDIVAHAASEGVVDALVPRDEAMLLAPLPNPRRLRDCTCFLQHLRNARAVRYRRLAAREADPDAAMERFRAEGAFDIPQEWEEAPVCLNSNHLSIVGPEHEVSWPLGSRRMDYELELAAVTGRGGNNVAAAEAKVAIFGYTIFNDISARDIQAVEIRTGAGLGGPGKDFDTGNILGPCIVTADEIDDPYNLAMHARVNGEEWSAGSSSQMDHSFEDVLVHISRDQSFYPGEVFGSGTVPTGCGLEHDRYLEDGDVIELEVEKIGILRNRIVKPAG